MVLNSESTVFTSFLNTLKNRGIIEVEILGGGNLYKQGSHQ
jgi:hypothetical protein